MKGKEEFWENMMQERSCGRELENNYFGGVAV